MWLIMAHQTMSHDFLIKMLMFNFQPFSLQIESSKYVQTLIYVHVQSDLTSISIHYTAHTYVRKHV